jgi:hypothetical protein
VPPIKCPSPEVTSHKGDSCHKEGDGKVLGKGGRDSENREEVGDREHGKDEARKGVEAGFEERVKSSLFQNFFPPS